MSIALAMEIPTAYLEKMTPWTDLDFALAHQVLVNDHYAEFYLQRPANRILILDNSMHELGEPLSLKDLRDAAFCCGADYVIPPDKLGQPNWNLEQYELCARALGDDFKLAPVLAGQTSSTRLEYLRRVRHADMLCLPFRENRLRWFEELEGDISAFFNRVHLLGVNELDELRDFTRWSTIRPNIRFSVDTSKPIKWAHADSAMELMYQRLISTRGAKLSSVDLLNVNDLSDAQLILAERNVSFLRTFLS